MHNSTMTLVDILAAARQNLRTTREAIQNATDHCVVNALAVLFNGTAPTGGEILTALATLLHHFATLEKNFQEQKNALWGAGYFALVQRYWKERRPNLSVELHPLIDRILVLTSEEINAPRLTPCTHALENKLLFMDPPEEYLAWRAELKNLSTKYSEDAFTLSRAMLASYSALSETIRQEISDSLSPGNQLLTSEISLWEKSCCSLAAEFTKGSGPVYLNGKEMYCDQAFNHIRSTPGAFTTIAITLPIEETITGSLATHERWQQTGVEKMSPPLLLGSLQAFSNANCKEALLRFFEKIGIRPTKDADLVFARRGYQGYPATYWLQANGELTTVICTSSTSQFDHVSIFRGLVAEALEWIKETYHPVGNIDPESQTSMDEYLATTEPARAGTPLNFISYLDPQQNLADLENRTIKH